MENKKPQNTVTETKRQLIEKAIIEISDIQLTGQAVRMQIDTAKEYALDVIQADNAQKQLNDAHAATRRSELLKKMSDAAKSGNLSEMQHIKKLLDSEG